MAVLHLLQSLRPQYWPLSIVAGLVGLYLSLGRQLDFRAILVALVLAAISATAEVVNDYADRKTDHAQRVKRFGPIILAGGSGLTASGASIGRSHILATIILATVALVGAIPLGKPVFLLAILGTSMAVGYSVEPVRLKTRGFLGVLTIAFGRGVVSFHIGWLAGGTVSMESLLMSLSITLIAFGPACLSSIADYVEDACLGLRTYAVAVGRYWAALTATVSAGLAAAIFVGGKLVGFLHPNWFLLPIVTLLVLLAILTVRETRSAYRRVPALQFYAMCLVILGSLTLA